MHDWKRNGEIPVNWHLERRSWYGCCIWNDCFLAEELSAMPSEPDGICRSLSAKSSHITDAPKILLGLCHGRSVFHCPTGALYTTIASLEYPALFHALLNNCRGLLNLPQFWIFLGTFANSLLYSLKNAPARICFLYWGTGEGAKNGGDGKC